MIGTQFLGGTCGRQPLNVCVISLVPEQGPMTLVCGSEPFFWVFSRDRDLIVSMGTCICVYIYIDIYIHILIEHGLARLGSAKLSKA